MIIASSLDQYEEQSAVKLARYARIIKYNECAFWGVYDGSTDGDQCRAIWTKRQREEMARALDDAQRTIENVLDYFLSPRWVTGNSSLDNRLNDQQEFARTVITRWGMVIEPGVQATAVIESGASVSHASDPATIGVTTAVTTASEIVVYHPGTTVEIDPSAITFSGGVATIRIPRCRMVKSSLADNPETGLDYNDTDNFEETVDVVRVYNDSTTQGVLVTPHVCGVSCQQTGCQETTKTACLYVEESRVGRLKVQPANYVSGSWTNTYPICPKPTLLRLNYRAGLQQLPQELETAVVRLAHANLPDNPCGCDIFMWKNDRMIPEVLTRERINCPFGLTNGAWYAWRIANSHRIVKMWSLS